jgi:hypothetical protein
VLVRKPQSRNPPQPRYPDQVLSLLDTWSAQDFVDLEETEKLDSAISSVKVVQDGTISDAQELGLRRSLRAFLLAYHSGTFEAFHAFRAPSDQFKMTQGVLDFLKSEHKSLPQEPRSQLAIYWHTDKRENYTFVKGAAFKTARLEARGMTNLPPDVGFEIRTNKNVGLVSSGPTVEFVNAPEEILKAEGLIRCATIAIVTKNDDRAYPVYIRYYWSDKDAAWLPMQLATAYSGPRNFTFTF